MLVSEVWGNNYDKGEMRMKGSRKQKITESKKIMKCCRRQTQRNLKMRLTQLC